MKQTRKNLWGEEEEDKYDWGLVFRRFKQRKRNRRGWFLEDWLEYKRPCGHGTREVPVSRFRREGPKLCHGCSNSASFSKPVVEQSYRYWIKFDLAKKGKTTTLGMHEWILIVTKPCHYCGVRFGGDNRFTGKRFDGRKFKRNGIDCYDPELGYPPFNCVPCCWNCNRMKGKTHGDKFKAQLRRCSNHLFGGAIKMPISEVTFAKPEVQFSNVHADAHKRFMYVELHEGGIGSFVLPEDAAGFSIFPCEA